jgi:hypothetical protein
MPLSKIEELTDIFISRGYLKSARSLMGRSEFREQVGVVDHDRPLPLGDRSIVSHLLGIV